MTDVAASPFAAAAPDLIAAGFHPLTILPPTVTHHQGAGKAPGEFVSGSWRGMPGWAKYRESSPSTFQMGLWMKAPGAGVGVLTGTPAGTHPKTGEPLYFLALDIDTDGDALDEILRCIPPSPWEKRGNVGLTRGYRSPAAIVSQSFDRAASAGAKASRLVDVLAAGRQCVVPPSAHKSTGRPYVWTGSGSVAAHELPVFDEDNLAVLVEVLETLGYEPEAKARRADSAEPRIVRTPGSYASDFEEVNGEGLARADEWFPALNLPRTRRTRVGWSAVPVWRDSNTARPTEMRKLNLSLSTGTGGAVAGIKDFGASGSDANLTCIDLVMRALDVDAVEAMQWLREKLDLDHEADGVVIDVAAFVANAEARKETAPPVVLAERTDGAAGVEKVAGETNKATIANTVQGETHGENELPARLIAGCTGLLGGLAQYICDSARMPQPTFALAAALSILGTAAGRRYAGPTFSGTHTYSVLVGGSGRGKDHALEMVPRILEAAGMGHHTGSGDFMSFQAVFKSIGKQPLQLCPVDELGSFLGRLSRKGAGGNEAAISGVLRTIWGKSFGTLPVPAWATFDAATVHVPALSILGASTPEEFFRSLEGGAIDNGFLNRWLLFPSYTRPAQRKPLLSKFEVPPLISDGLSQIYNVGGAMTAATMHNGRCDAPLRVVQWEGGDEGPLAAEYYGWARTLDEDADTESLFARCAEQAIRIATISAIGSDAEAPVITRQCFDWAREVALWCTRAMVTQSADYMAENQTQADRARVLRTIKRAGKISHRDLTRKLTSFKARELDEIVRTLIAAEQAQVTNVVNETNGKTTKLYTYSGGE